MLMKKTLSRLEAQEEINEFFGGGRKFSVNEVRKIKRLAMKYNIKLGSYRRLFCKKCFSFLKGKTRVTETHKIVECGRCGAVNKQRIRFK